MESQGKYCSLTDGTYTHLYAVSSCKAIVHGSGKRSGTSLKVAPKYLFCCGNSCNKANKQTKAPFCAKMSLVGVVNPVCFLLFKK